MTNLPDLRPDVGHDFVDAVCVAIESVTQGARARQRDAFIYDGIDLVYAIERDLFMSVVNNTSLHLAFSCIGNCDPAPVVRVTKDLDRQVAEHVLAGRGKITLEQVWRPRRAFRGARARLHALLDRRTESLPEPQPPPIPKTVKACILIKHSKFLRYIEPVIDLVGRDSCFAIVVHEAQPAAVAAGISWRLYTPWEVGRDELGKLAEGLEERWSIVQEYEFLLRIFRDVRPGCVVVLEGSAPSDELANRAAASLGIPCLCIQQGWAPMINTGFRNMSFTAMAVWGDGFADLLAPRNPSQRFEVTGSVALDDFDLGQTERVERSSALTALFALQAPAPTISHAAMRSILSLIDAVAERCPEVRILVRDHPGHSYARELYGWEPSSPAIEFVSPVSYALREVLLASDVVVSISSTTLLEGVALLRPAVVVNETAEQRHSPDLEALGAGVEAETSREAIEVVARLLRDEQFRASFLPGMERFRDRFFDGCAPGAAQRLATLISSLQESARVETGRREGPS